MSHLNVKRSHEDPVLTQQSLKVQSNNQRQTTSVLHEQGRLESSVLLYLHRSPSHWFVLQEVIKGCELSFDHSILNNHQIMWIDRKEWKKQNQIYTNTKKFRNSNKMWNFMHNIMLIKQLKVKFIKLEHNWKISLVLLVLDWITLLCVYCVHCRYGIVYCKCNYQYHIKTLCLICKEHCFFSGN